VKGEQYKNCEFERPAKILNRGYAIQYGLPISLQSTISLSSVGRHGDVYVHGLVNLAELFAKFDSSSVPRFSRYKEFPISASGLVHIEHTLADTSPSLTRFDTVQRADFLVTKQWMRILLWQQAMSRRFLSSFGNNFMTFAFPVQVTRELLRLMVMFSTENLTPLGRDQVSYSTPFRT